MYEGVIEHYMCVKDKSGQQLQDKKEILSRWREHFDEISNISHLPILEGLPCSGPLPQIVTEEVTTDIVSMKNQSITIPIFKNKGDPVACSNYRPICLLSHIMKIFERVLDQCLQDIVQISGQPVQLCERLWNN
ncbi:hypothetical protein P4O66_003183 [Electrophorus voltai]|uniref:Uncharacterized protein n=1 Tax=Electrophorus voltai TaxID=2609070 RepID=A0AAD9DKF9_9TELE|nr:hypothetical protein P4O66_003183 [Electrophorus voltai]